MRYLLALLIVVLLVFGYTAWQNSSGNGKSASSGIVHYGSETLTTLNSTGFVTLDGTFVRKELTVHGSLSAEKAQINNMTVQGRASLTDSVISGQSSVYGFLRAKGTSFRGPIEFSGHGVTFEDSNLDAIVVKKPFWAFLQQTIELSGKTICKGTITFESGKGKVIVSGKSQMLGSVQGGEVEKQ